MNNLTLRAILTGAFGLLALVVMLISGFALKSLFDANQRFDVSINGVTRRIDMAGQVRGASAHRAIAARNLVLVTSPKDLAVKEERVLVAHKEATESLAELKRLGEAPDVPEEARRLISEMDRIT